MPALSGPACVRCGDPLASDAEAQGRDGQCRTCAAEPPAFARAVAYGVYEERMRAAIHAMKYDRIHSSAKRLGRMLAQGILKLHGEAPAAMLVIPVPLHRGKKKERGFNQARSLAEHAVAELKKTHPEWKLRLEAKALMRVRPTESQAGLTQRQRRLNMRAAFEVMDAEAVRDRDVLLVDDILTTGATARAAGRALKRAGARSVWVATLARAGRAFPDGGGMAGGEREGWSARDREENQMESPGALDTPADANMHSSTEFI